MQAVDTRPALAPVSPSYLNSTAIAIAAAGEGKKRKRQEAEGSQCLAPFTARALLPTTKADVVTFAPLVSIDRPCLPLVWLDLSATQNELPPGYIFGADISHLQTTHQAVLVARLCPNGRLYAIDTAAEGAYTACLLRDWVTEEFCFSAAQGIRHLLDLQTLQKHERSHTRSGSDSSNVAAILPTPTSPRRPKNRRGALARMSIMASRDSSEAIPDTRGQSPLQSTDADPLASASSTIVDKTPDAPLCNPQDQHHIQDHGPAAAQGASSFQSLQTIVTAPDSLTPEIIRLHYLETLYLSRTSLAFYAKGALNRTRAQARQVDSGLTLDALKEVYENSVLPSKKFDTKYRDTLPTKLNSISSTITEDLNLSKPQRRRSSNKPKLGRDCLYPEEHGIIAKWWQCRDFQPSTSAGVGENQEVETRRAVAELRTRETQMQLLLILEIGLINLLESRNRETTVQQRGPPVKEEPKDAAFPDLLSKHPHTQKKREFSGDLEAMLDRLCIWHSVSLDDVTALPERAQGESGTAGAASKDKLRDFCKDVIMPFYASKLPDQVRSICRKLGGPNVSPQRPKPSHSRSTGHAASDKHSKTQARPKVKRSLERVLSEDMATRHPSPPIMPQSRSIAGVPKLKRERSASITRPASRSSMQRSVSFSNREIDLVAASRIQEAKKRKLEKVADQKKELAAAIDALKKPNRSNAAKAFMDDVEARVPDAKPGSKRTNHLIQITATPRKARPSSTGNEAPGRELEAEPVVPASAVKPQLVSTAHSSSKKGATVSVPHGTPSRDRLSAASLRDQLPVARTVVEATPAANRTRRDVGTPLLETPHAARMTKSGRPVLFTPIKRNELSIEQAFRDAPEIPENAGKAMDRVMGGKVASVEFGFESSRPKTIGNTKETSIYDQLGWNDDFAEL